MGDAKATLGKGEGVISVHSSKPRGAWLLSGFAASEEGFEGQINAYRNVLEELGMDTFQRRTFLFQDREGLLLLIEREASAFLLIGCLTAFKQVVIEPTALFKCLVELPDLLLIRKDTILKHFTHGRIIAQMRTDLKRRRWLLHRCPKHGTLFIPCFKDRGFQPILEVNQSRNLASEKLFRNEVF